MCPAKSKPATRYGWTDELCLIEGQKCCVWKEIPANEVEAHLIKFVDLWFSKDTGNVKKISATIRNVLLMTPLGMTNELLLRNVFESAIKIARTPPAIVEKASLINEPHVDHLNPKEQNDVLAFYCWLRKHFDVLKGTRRKNLKDQCLEYNLASQKLRAVLGFCALLLMRKVKKNEAQMKRYFGYKAGKTFDRLYPDVCLPVCITAPTSDVLRLAATTITKDSLNKKAFNLLHLLVFQYLTSTTKDDESSRLTREILEEGCLKILEGNGMGLVSMFQDVKLIYPNIEERQLLSLITQDKRTTDSRKRLLKFLDLYAQRDKQQYSWKWARILSQNYFSDMNIRGNQLLCSQFAALLFDNNPRVFGHYDLRFQNVFSNSAVQWAEFIKETFKKMNDELEETM